MVRLLKNALLGKERKSCFFFVCLFFTTRWFIYIKNVCIQDLPGDTVDENLPANAGDTDLIPGPRIPHATGQLKPLCHSYWTCEHESPGATTNQLRAATTEARVPRACAHKRSLCSEEPMDRNKEQPQLATTRESPRAAMKTQYN